MGLEEKKMPFNIFHKKKQTEQEKPAAPPQEPKQEATAPTIEQPQPEPAPPVVETVQELPIATQEPQQEDPTPIPEPPKETVAPQVEQKQEIAVPPVEQKQESASKTYLKAMPLRELSDLENIKTEVKNGNIIILRVTPLAGKSIEDVKSAVNDLFQFAESIGGDIARLGEERVVICPKTIRIWREKSPAPVSSSSQPLPTAAA
jgi:SepF-like predicted cell division protein (DUF552 family)